MGIHFNDLQNTTRRETKSPQWLGLGLGLGFIVRVIVRGLGLWLR